MFKRYQTMLLLEISGFLYLLLFLVEPLRKSFGDIGLVLRNDKIFILLVLLLFFNFLAYLFIISFTNFSKFTFNKFFKWYIFFCLILLFIWPIASSDIFSYIYQGRVVSIYHANPYITTYSEFFQDNFYNLIHNHWDTNASPYGPLFIIISGILTWFGKNSLLLSVFLFKALFVGAHILTCYLIYKVSNLKTLFIYALNPLILFEVIINGHNDALVILALVLAFYFLQKKENLKHQLLAWFLLVISVLVKITTIILLPVIWLILLKENIKNKNVFGFIIKTLIITIVTLIIIYAPFLESLRIIYQPIMNQAAISGAYSIGILFVHWLLNLFTDSSLRISVFINVIIFSIVYFLTLLRIIFFKVVDYKATILKYSTLLFTVFYLTCLSWLMPWYFIVIILFGSLYWYKSPKLYYLISVYFFTIYGIFYYISLR
jgi:hypothetical protein